MKEEQYEFLKLLDGKKERIIIVDEEIEKILKRNKGNKNIIINLKDECAKEILDKYGMYEFTNKICLLFKDTNYGNINNYIETGIINYEELIRAVME